MPNRPAQSEKVSNEIKVKLRGKGGETVTGTGQSHGTLELIEQLFEKYILTPANGNLNGTSGGTR
jgi:hypothetical protein